jgi:hypothetical protein
MRFIFSYRLLPRVAHQYLIVSTRPDSIFCKIDNS